MKYDFDKIIDRHGSGCLKYDSVCSGVIPLWIADMDFQTPDFILDAIKKRLECPVLGYPCRPKNYCSTIARWVKRLHGWDVSDKHICYVPGIVKGIAIVEHLFFPEGTKVIIQPPVYHPFRIVSEKLGNQVLLNPLIERPDGQYDMDFDSLQECINDGGRLLVLSNPQNPSGQCWSADTLRRLAEITAERGVMVISDEIHAEMAHKGFRHVPYASVSPAAASNSITFMAPSKTFNIAGIVSSYAIVPDEKIREKFFAFMEATELDYPSIFSIEATMAAYNKGFAWRKQMLRYVEGNIAYVSKYIRKNIPDIKVVEPQASFLVWLDCRGLGLSHKALINLFQTKAHLYLNDGAMFGRQGEGFLRLNVGCPRSILEKAMNQLSTALGK